MLVLAAVAVLAASPVRVATTEWTFSGVEPVVGEAFLDRFATQLTAEGLKVTTAKDIATVLGMERQKQLLGCSDDATSCLAELAGALGVDALITGSVVKVGTGFTVTLRAVAAQSGTAIASATERVKTEDALQDWLDGQAKAMAEKITASLGLPVAKRSVRLLPWVPAVVGVGLVVGGGWAFSTAGARATQLSNWPAGMGEASQGQIHAIRVDGQQLETIGLALLGVGCAAIVASVLWFVLGAE